MKQCTYCHKCLVYMLDLYSQFYSKGRNVSQVRENTEKCLEECILRHLHQKNCLHPSQLRSEKQLFIHLTHKNAEIAFDRLGKCLEDVKLWLCANKLKLNADKTDFIIFGSKSQQKKLNPFFPVNILGESLIPSDAVKNLGVWFDSDFSFTKHVKNVCKLCFIQMRDLRQIRQ